VVGNDLPISAAATPRHHGQGASGAHLRLDQGACAGGRRPSRRAQGAQQRGQWPVAHRPVASPISAWAAGGAGRPSSIGQTESMGEQRLAFAARAGISWGPWP